MLIGVGLLLCCNHDDFLAVGGAGVFLLADLVDADAFIYPKNRACILILNLMKLLERTYGVATVCVDDAIFAIG